jgi:hypothetical protein
MPIDMIFVTQGNWDLKTMFPSQAKREGVKLPNYFKKWIDISLSFSQTYKKAGKKGMKGILKYLDIVKLKHKKKRN